MDAMRTLRIVALGVLLACLSAYAQTQPPGFDRQRLIDRFVSYDAAQNNGKGYSESADSGTLGWGESYVLDNYVKMYRVTGDAKWLDRIVEHADRMFANMSDPDGDGIPGWRTDTYSVAEVRATALHNRGTATIAPDFQRITDINQAHAIRAGDYAVEFPTRDRYNVRDLKNYQILRSGTYASGAKIEGIPGVSVTVTGLPEPGDKFRVEARGVQPIEYAVHEGMFLYPVAQFIEIALRDSTKRARYETKARAYLKLIEDRILAKQERYWLDATDRAGGYRATESWSERYPNRILPHNQYLALARVYLVLKDVSDNPRFLDRATRMAAYFKANLKQTGNAYTWNYWDWVEEGAEGHSGAEDTSHGSIDIGFAVEAWRRGVVFAEDDIRQFSRTFLDQMWNGALDNPGVGANVNTKSGTSAIFIGWTDLCAVEPKVFDALWALYRKNNEPASSAPTLLYGWATLNKSEGLGMGDAGWTLIGSVLRPNFPNPFNSETTIPFTVGGRGPSDLSEVALSIYNIVGQRIRTLIQNAMPSGVHRTTWDGRDDAGRRQASGVYLCRMVAGTFQDTRKMVLVK